MSDVYQTYIDADIDASCIGLGRGRSGSAYFCTPKGAKVIGWAGVDGIHYCFVRGFGKMVFAVSPMNTPGHYVHPLARDFSDFMRLVLACGDAGVLEQVFGWDRTQFDAFMQHNQPSAEQRAVLAAIGALLSLVPMEDPFAYVKTLQAEFDYSRIIPAQNEEELSHAGPEAADWKVYFDGALLQQRGRKRPGREVPLNKHFWWNGERWYLPAAYLCSNGLVLDFCACIPAGQILAFMKKWNLSEDSGEADFTQEEQMCIDADNPLALDIRAQVMLGANVIPSSHGCSVSWNPCLPHGNSAEAKRVLAHYELDPAYGWVLHRAAFPWATRRRPRVDALSVTLSREPSARPGMHFHVSAPGERIPFVHPATGVQHTLHVEEYEQRQLDHSHFGSRNQEFPTHYTVMSYTLRPELSDRAFSVTDCVQSDQPRQKYVSSVGTRETDGITGRADGPIAMFQTCRSREKLHCTCSALRFAQTNDVEWRMIFREKACEDLTLTLI